MWVLDADWEIVKHFQYDIMDSNIPGDCTSIKEINTKVPGLMKDEIQAALVYNEDLAISVLYSDGMGRSIQEIAVRQSPAYKDLVNFHQYDQTGRESKFFAPFTKAGNNGNRVLNPETNQAHFYNNSNWVAHTNFPFAEIEYENSPLDRVLKQGSMGEQWQVNGDHTIEQNTLVNDNNEILLWKITSNGYSAMNNGLAEYYPTNTLSKKQVTNEEGVTTWEYKNSRGQVICKRARVRLNGPLNSPYSMALGTGDINGEQWYILNGLMPTWRNIDTYFIYDEFGRLVSQVPAIAVLKCNGDYRIVTVSGGTNYSIYNGYMMEYKYDRRSRIIEEKKPGEGWSYYVYNKLNAMVMSRSPELSDKWNFAKYDGYGRVIQTGTVASNLQRSVLQMMCDDLSEHLWEDRTGSIQNPYTNNSFPILDIGDVVLIEHYYDNYRFDLNGFDFQAFGNVDYEQCKRIFGMPTGSKTMVLDDNFNHYLTSVVYYDSKVRPSVTFVENLLGGLDKSILHYNESGQVANGLRLHYHLSGDTPIEIFNSFEYDHAGRPTIMKQRTGNADEEVILSKLVYNEMGQVVKKHLHITDETNTGMQVMDYRYNERGWLTQINNADLVNDGDNLEHWDVFGEELIYNDETRYYSERLDMIPRFDGNIAAVKWKSKSDPELDGSTLGGHSYVYRYDKLGQMTGAFYAGSSDIDPQNYTTNVHNWDERVSYDINGNILNMSRNRGKDDFGNPLQPNQNPLIMDNLIYRYFDNSNKIKSINETDGITSWANSYSHFIDLVNTDIEYQYDEEGRMINDSNKGLSFTYNHLDLVKEVSEGNETASFIWSADGQKLAKSIGSNTTYYMGGIEYNNNQLSSISTPVGMTRLANGNAVDGDWVYDYYIQDYLGNLRVVITEELAEIVTEKVTVELQHRYAEDANFDNVSSTQSDKPYLYPYDPSDPNSQKVAKLSVVSGKVIGPAKIMAIKKGESLDLSTKYWYSEVPGEPLTSVGEVFVATLLNLGMASNGIIPSGPEQGMALINNVSGSQYNALYNFINNSFDQIDLSKPQAYLVYMYFNKKMELIPECSGKIQVGDANSLGMLYKEKIVPREDGYFYTFVTNRSANSVNFDNLTIKHYKPVVRATYDYYAYGLMWENPALPASPEGIHNETYQGKEFQFSEFSTGHGLALYDFHARMYDPAIGRWLVPDPARQYFNPYLAMGNNPVSQIDPSGRNANHWDGWIGTPIEGDGTRWDWVEDIDSQEEADAEYGKGVKVYAKEREFKDGHTGNYTILAADGTVTIYDQKDGARLSEIPSRDGGNNGNLEVQASTISGSDGLAPVKGTLGGASAGGMTTNGNSDSGGYLDDAGMLLSLTGTMLSGIAEGYKHELTHEYKYGYNKQTGLIRGPISKETVNRASRISALRSMKNLKGVGNNLAVIGVLTTIADGVYGDEGWKNHHTADVSIQTGLAAAAFFAVPGVGWVAGAYFIFDLGWRAYSGRSITESLFD
jgi:RHS repeat-associated protein